MTAPPSQHVPDDLLQAFVEGDVGEQLAVHIAEHIDTCPACATRAAGLEPLAAAFAAVTDPVPPPDLAARALARAIEPERFPIPEIAVGLALLSGAALLVIALESPLSIAADLGVTLSVLTAVGRTLSTALASFQSLLAVTMIAALAGVLVTLHYAAAPVGLLPEALAARLSTRRTP